MKTYDMVLKGKRAEFFDKFGIRPKYIHTGCEHYVETETDSWCAVSEQAKLTGKCQYAKKEYPEITDSQLLELIVIASGLFPVSFAFERGKADIEDIVLSSLINYEDIQGIARRDIRKLFGRR